MAPVAGPVSLNPQGRAGPRLPYHGTLATRVPLHLSCCVSVLGDRGYSGPSLSATRLLPLTICPSLSLLYGFKKKSVSLSSESLVWGTIEAKLRRGNKQRSAARHEAPLPAVTGLWGGTAIAQKH